jgi:hypothetical protein
MNRGDMRKKIAGDWHTERKPFVKFDLWAFAAVYIVVITMLIVLNLAWCSYFATCWIDDKRHIHGESFLSGLGI